MTEIGTLNRQTPASTSSSACCLIENGKRCLRPAGSHCFSKRMQKTVRQKRLKVTIASEVCLNYFYLLFVNYFHNFIMTCFFRSLQFVAFKILAYFS